MSAELTKAEGALRALDAAIQDAEFRAYDGMDSRAADEADRLEGERDALLALINHRRAELGMPAYGQDPKPEPAAQPEDWRRKAERAEQIERAAKERQQAEERRERARQAWIAAAVWRDAECRQIAVQQFEQEVLAGRPSYSPMMGRSTPGTDYASVEHATYADGTRVPEQTIVTDLSGAEHCWAYGKMIPTNTATSEWLPCEPLDEDAIRRRRRALERMFMLLDEEEASAREEREAAKKIEAAYERPANNPFAALAALKGA